MSIDNKAGDVRYRQHLENSIAGADRHFRHSAFHTACLPPLAFETNLSVGKRFRYVANKYNDIEKKVEKIIDFQQLYSGVTATAGNLPNRLAWRPVQERDDKMLMVEVAASSPAKAANSSGTYAGHKLKILLTLPRISASAWKCVTYGWKNLSFAD